MKLLDYLRSVLQTWMAAPFWPDDALPACARCASEYGLEKHSSALGGEKCGYCGAWTFRRYTAPSRPRPWALIVGVCVILAALVAGTLAALWW